MAAHSSSVLPIFDFTEALTYSISERMRLCVRSVYDRAIRDRQRDNFGLPAVPQCGATEEELQALESSLGSGLPAEYRDFLAKWRYLILNEGLQIWGFDYRGVSIGCPWISDRDRPGMRYLVFADYWKYADGDQLIIDLENARQEVVAYLHEHGPLYEAFAPSFSLALWRMAFEELDR